MKTRMFFTALLIWLAVSPLMALKPGETGGGYDLRWKKVDSLTGIGLPKSALTEVEKIYGIAKAEKNEGQLVKAIIYRLKLKSQYMEDFQNQAIREVKAEITVSSEPVSQILHSALGEIYWWYYRNNHFRLMDRSALSSYRQDSIQTWDLNRIAKEIISEYSLSLNNAKLLQGVPIEKFSPVLEIPDNSGDRKKAVQPFRPTLYDFLAFRALDYFSGDAGFTSVPVNGFQVSDPCYTGPAKDFISCPDLPVDSTSLAWYAVGIYQKLLTFHFNDASPLAIVDLELQRLGFIHEKAVFERKDSLYFEALKSLESAYINDPASTNVDFAMATFLQEQGAKYQPLLSSGHKWDLRDATEICRRTISRFPGSEGAANCRTLMKSLLMPALDITAEYATPVEKPFLALVSYKKIPDLFYRLIRTNPDEDQERVAQMQHNDLLKFYAGQPFYAQGSLVLPLDGDLQRHGVEIPLDAVPAGYYILLVSGNNDFSDSLKTAAYVPFWSTQISYISQRQENGDLELYILDRETGKPIKNVTAEAYVREFSYASRKYEIRKTGEYLSDENGHFSVPATSSRSGYSNLMFRLKSRDDLFYSSDFYQYASQKYVEKPSVRTYFFTDRAIYRPGQTVYFKGIVVDKKGDDKSIRTDYQTTVVFRDVNSQEVSKQSLTTNEFGSFHGSFAIPKGLMAGDMSISNDNGSISFSVEEYKRPTFEVSFEPVQGNFRLNEKVTLKGKAVSYAGSSIDHAEVRYRVIRKARFPFLDYRWWWCPLPSLPDVEITNGILQTGTDGTFNIIFNAVPDLSIDKTFDPVFDFDVMADVTDLNGETQSNETSVAAGYRSLIVHSSVSDKLDLTKDTLLQIFATNLNGQHTPAVVAIKIERLLEPGRIFKSRNWPRPDTSILSREAFYGKFPYDAYMNDNDPLKWGRAGTIFEKTVSTATDSVLHIGLTTLRNQLSAALKKGPYLLTLSATDPFGQNVENISYFIAYLPDDREIPVNSTDWFVPLKFRAEPGETASFLIGTKETNLHIIYDIRKKDSLVSRQFLRLGEQQKQFDIPIREEDRGNISVNIAYVMHNRTFQHAQTIVVPFTNKDLKVTFETFRDKLQPGQKEEWKIKIRDDRANPVQAEFMAALYDASLDVFRENNWMFNLFSGYFGSSSWDMNSAFQTHSGYYYPLSELPPYSVHQYYQLNWFGMDIGGGGRYAMKRGRMTADNAMLLNQKTEAAPSEEEQKPATAVGGTAIMKDKAVKPKESFSGYTVRKDFRETAFFYPDLRTDAEGNLVLSFTIPESLTRWKFMGLAHTKTLQTGEIEKQLVTQKDLMVFPNTPRFLRLGDQFAYLVKITNLSEKDLSGNVRLQITDPFTSSSLDSLVTGNAPEQSFTVIKGQSISVEWTVRVPEKTDISALSFRVVAVSGTFSDGEEKAVPVLTNRVLVTETLPLPVRGSGTTDFSFERLLRSGQEKTIGNYNLSLEFSSNPAWYAVQALPVLSEPKYKCADAVFDAFYATSIASHIANSSPKIKQVFDSWANLTPDALRSNLEKNQDLKSALLQEMPWVLEARSETERKQRIAVLFDLNNLSQSLNENLDRLKKMQTQGGGWPWFDGMPDSRYITQSIVTGLARLDHLGVTEIMKDPASRDMLVKAIHYLDREMLEDYDNLKKYYPGKMDEEHIGSMQIYYLYSRSFFNEGIPFEGKTKTARDYYLSQAEKYWLKQDHYFQGMIALALNRSGNKTVPQMILRSLSEKALHSGEMGMYWALQNGYYWYQAPIETQSLLIEAYDEIMNDQNSVEEMKIWLLKQKQTQDWKTSRATADACYALLLRGANLLADNPGVKIRLGDEIIDPAKLEGTTPEAGTGYFQVSWKGKEIKPSMGQVQVSKTGQGVAWGALYWQYFENIDKVTAAASPLKVEKQILIEQVTPSGAVYVPVEENKALKRGDKVRVRLVVTSDRDLEYVHLKDLRASTFEPGIVLSGYHYQDGLGYYQTTTDLATNFFFDWLPKGTYVFEYPLTVALAGDFSSGMATVQCMYAPEFAAHSAGMRIQVTK